MNKRTAFVYFGAAFLIIVFGFRTLARTTESLKFLEDLLTPITVFALLLEFGLLIYYGYGIYVLPDAGEVPSSKSTNLKSEILSGDQKDKVYDSITTYTEEMSNINDSLERHNGHIESLNDKLENLVDTQLEEKVKDILSSMIKK